MMNSLQRVDYLTHELVHEHPQCDQMEVETAVLLAALEIGNSNDREKIRDLVHGLLNKMTSDTPVTCDEACPTPNRAAGPSCRTGRPSSANTPHL